MAVLGVTNTFSSGTAIVASQMNTNFDDIEAFVNTTPGVLQLTGGTVTGAVQLNNTLTLGSSGAGHDVKLWGDTALDYFEWDADTNKLTIEGANGTTAIDVSDGNVVIGDGTLTVSGEIDGGSLDISGNADIDGIANLDVVDIDGAVDMASTLTLAGALNTVADIDMSDAGKILLGTGDDLQIYANGSNSFIDHNGDGDLWIRANATGENIYINSATKILLQTQGVSKLDVELDGSLFIMPANTYPIELGEGHTKNLTGSQAFGRNALLVNTGNYNIGIGFNAMVANTSGNLNVAVGGYALDGNVTGTHNTAVGTYALHASASFASNVAIGYNAMGASTSSNNVAIGNYALDDSNSGGTNVAIGYNCATALTTGTVNTYVGPNCAQATTEASHNVMLGYTAGLANTTGGYNVIIGSNAGKTLTTASNSVIIGEGAGWYVTGVQNTFVGMRAGHQVTTGVNNTALGWHALYTASFTGGNTTCLGYNAQPSAADADNEITMGDSNISAFRCQVDVTVLSDGRDKADIQDLDVGLDFVKRLRPRRWSWDMREENGKHGIADAGFVAQELQQAQTDEGAVIPNLVYEKNPDRLESSKATLIPVLVKAVQELAEKVEAMA
jgi:hypothetical protein